MRFPHAHVQVGNGDLTLGMQRAHFALWAVIKAPLLIGADLRRLATPQGKPSLDILLVSVSMCDNV
jgi:hypothetical protein